VLSVCSESTGRAAAKRGLACNPSQTRQQLLALELFLLEEDMVVGFDKTKVLVFNASHQLGSERRQVFRLNNVAIDRISEYNDLGLLTKQQHTVSGMIKHIAKRGQRAVAILHRKVKELGVRVSANAMLLLFQAIVLPNLTFGCEIWGPWILQADFAADTAFTNAIERVRMSFLRVLLGLKSSTPGWNVIREVGWYPLQVFVARQLVRWMNKLWSMPASTIARQAMQECWQLFFDGNTDNWCGKLHAFFSEVGIQPASFLDEHPSIPIYCEQRVVDTLRCRSHRVYLDLLAAQPPLALHSSKLLQYHLLFGDHLEIGVSKWRRARYLNLPLSPQQLKLLARFRLSNHFLAVEVGRWRRPEPVPFAERVCELCGDGSVQDEFHHVFVCTALHAVRAALPSLFVQGRTPNLNSLFALRGVTYADRFLVAKDLCLFLQQAGGVYNPPTQQLLELAAGGEHDIA
jgi:hypothetical protein